MAYKIAFKKSVAKDFKKIDAKKAEAILIKIETYLAENADKHPSLKGKFAGLRKYRIGDYRVIYTIFQENVLLILRVAHRKEVYKK